MPRSVRQERWDLAKSARREGKSWVAIADMLRNRWPELTPRAALRIAHCWTQRDVAIAWSKRFRTRQPEDKEISRCETWSSGSRGRPSLEMLDRYAQLYECAISDLLADVSDYRYQDRNYSNGPTADSRDGGRTPQFDALAEVESAQDDEAQELRERIVAAALVDDQTTALLAAQADRIREVDRMLGARVAESQVRGHLDALDQLRTFAIAPGRREAVAYLYADAATLAGWQSLDLGNLKKAWDYYESAKQAASEVAPPTSLAHALAEQAYVLVDVGNVADALQLAEYATSVAGTAVPSLLRSWLAAVLGEIHATLGNDAASRRAFGRADDLLPAEPQDPTMSYVILDQVHLARWRGNALAKLGDRGAIDDLRRAAAAIEPTFNRARAGLHVDLAQALAASGSTQEADLELRAASSLASQVGSARQRRRIRQLQSVLQAS